jgi:hypothetical protein
MTMSKELADAVSTRLGNETDPTSRVYGAAVEILKQKLGDDFLTRKVRKATPHDPFLLNKGDEQSDEEQRLHIQRVCSLADALYKLEGQKGFDALCNRLTRKRAIDPAYADSEVAKLIARRGYEVEIKTETGQRGKDFDMVVRKNGAPDLNVEVTNSDAKTFRPGTVKNILQSKRSQVPKGEPAGLFVLFPISWFDGQPNLLRELENVTNAFFGGSSRYNFVCFIWHPVVVRGNAVIHATIRMPLKNKRAACPYDDLSFFDVPIERKEEWDRVRAGHAVTPEPEKNFDFMTDYNEATKEKVVASTTARRMG